MDNKSNNSMLGEFIQQYTTLTMQENTICSFTIHTGTYMYMCITCERTCTIIPYIVRVMHTYTTVTAFMCRLTSLGMPSKLKEKMNPYEDSE